MMTRSEYVNAVDKERMEDVLKKIDNDLREKVKYNLEFSDTCALWILLEGTLSEGEKKVIASELEEAEWRVASIRNSEDNGERPGLFSVKIY